MLSYQLDEDEDSDEEDDDNGTGRIDSRTKILPNSSRKVQQLLLFLTTHMKKYGPDRKMKGIIFVKRRHTAKCLAHIIKRYVQSEPVLDIRPDFMVGSNSNLPGDIEQILANKQNRKVLERFKKNEINLIVASNVLEEGIDIQVCNLIVMYDIPETFRSYVQSKGRARMAQSDYVIMVSSAEQNKLTGKIREWREINDILKRVSNHNAPLRSIVLITFSTFSSFSFYSIWWRKRSIAKHRVKMKSTRNLKTN